MATIDELRTRMPLARTRSQPAQPDLGTRHPARRPRGLPRTRLRPRQRPHPIPHQGRCRQHRRTPARTAPARQGTSSSGPTRSPSATASPSPPENAPQTTLDTPTTPTRRVTNTDIAHCVGGVISPLLANIYLHVLDTELSVRGVGELVRYATSGGVVSPPTSSLSEFGEGSTVARGSGTLVLSASAPAGPLRGRPLAGVAFRSRLLPTGTVGRAPAHDPDELLDEVGGCLGRPRQRDG